MSAGRVDRELLTVCGPVQVSRDGSYTHFIISKILQRGQSTRDGIGEDTDISIENLWKIRQNPSSHRYNCSLDSADVALRELKALKTHTVLVDLHAVEDSDILGLRKIQESLNGVCIVCCTGRARYPSETDAASLAERMISDLLVGVDVAHPVKKERIRTGAIALSIQGFEEGDIGTSDIVYLQACAAVHKIYPLVPLFIEFQSYSRTHLAVLDLLTTFGARISSVVLCNTVLSRPYLAYLSDLLSNSSIGSPLDGPCVSIDSIGSVHLPLTGPMYPNDEEIIDNVVKLVELGYENRIILSPSIRYKIDLRCCGGNGYGHIEQIEKYRIVTALQASTTRPLMDTESEINEAPAFEKAQLKCSKLVGLNGIQKVFWFTPPEAAVVEPERWPCYVCGTLFLPGEHYSKYNFLYCSSKCLAVHRQADWRQKL